MAKPTILIVEDDGILAIHLQDLLTRQGYEVLKPVPTGEKAILAVKDHTPDLILMDIELGGELNGINTAEQLAAITDTPVVFLTGFSQDPLLQQAKIASPYGYLVKPVPERELAATIEMALHKHIIDHQIKISEAKYRSLIEQASDGIFLADKDGNYTEINTVGCSMLGYTREELLSMNMRDVVAPEDLALTPLKINELINGSVLRTERQFIRKDGIGIPVEISGRLLENGSIQGIVRDITERKQAEDKLKSINERFDLATRAAHLGVWDWDITNNVLVWDDTMFKLYGVEKERFGSGYGDWLHNLHPDDAALNNELTEKALRGECEYDTEFRLIWPDGSLHWIKAFGQVIRQADGTPIRMIGVNFDITEQKAADEQIRLESAALNAAANAIVITDRNGNVEWVNPAFTRLTGYTFEETINHNMRDLVKSGKQTQEFYKQMWDTILSGSDWQGELVNRRKDGSLFSEVMTITPLLNSKREITQFISIKQNITEWKKAEEIRKHLEEKFTKVFQISPDAIAITRLEDGKFVDINVGYSEFSGYSPEEILGKTSIELKIWPSPIDRESFVRELNEKGEVNNLEMRFRIKNGQVRYCLVSSKVIEIEGEKCTLSITRDITERKKIEQELRNSEERYRLLFEEMAEGYALHEIILDEESQPIDYRFLDVNPAFVKQTGLLKENIIGHTVKEILPQTEEYWINEYGQVALTGKVLHYENYSEAIGKWFKVTAFSPKFGQFAVTVEDITESKNAHISLTESEERFRQLADNVREVFWLRDVETRKILYISPAYEQIWGQSCESLYENPESFITQIYPDDLEVFMQGQQEMWDRKKGLNEEFRINHPDGSIHWVSSQISPVKSDKGEVIRFAGILEDITEKKLAEEAIRNTQIHFQSLIENAPDGIALIDYRGQFKYVSPSGRKNFGYSVDDDIDISPDDVTHPDDLPIVLETLNKTIQDPSLKLNLEYRFRHKDGTYRWIESTFTNLFAEPSVQAIVINFRDITLRREADLKIQEQLDELRRWYENTLGREMRVIELKEEVNSALQQSGQPPRYHLSTPKEPANEC